MKSGTLSLIFFFCGATLGSAQTIDSCLSISNDESRLACYDVVMGYSTNPLEIAVESDKSDESSITSNWTFVDNTDDFTDKNTSYLALSSDPAGRRGDDSPKTLVIRCDGRGSFNVYMVFDGYMGGRNDRIPVQYRFGDGRAISESWSESTDGTAGFLPAGYNDFLNGLKSGEDFIFEGKDYRGSSSRANFDNSLDPKFDFIFNGCVE